MHQLLTEQQAMPVQCKAKLMDESKTGGEFEYEYMIDGNPMRDSRI